MTALQVFMSKIAKAFICNLRESTYNDMAHQASDWIPEEARTEKTVCKNPPIKLDFAVPKKHRLAWICRTIQHFPH
jgi:hypothetical protein